MNNCKSKLLGAIFFSIYSLNASAVSIDIVQSSLFLSVDGTTYQDDQQGYYPDSDPQTHSFGGGFDLSYSDNLNSDNLGELSWLVTNNTGADVVAASIFGFLDADLGSIFFNDYGDTFGSLSSSGQLSGYSGWEIDEPLFPLGDIFSHLEDGDPLDNLNSVGSTPIFDVSLALAFDINDWADGETILANFLISGSQPSAGAGLAQFDNEGSGNALYFSGSVSVPTPGSAGLMFSGLVLVAVARKRRKKEQ